MPTQYCFDPNFPWGENMAGDYYSKVEIDNLLHANQTTPEQKADQHAMLVVQGLTGLIDKIQEVALNRHVTDAQAGFKIRRLLEGYNKPTILQYIQLDGPVDNP